MYVRVERSPWAVLRWAVAASVAAGGLAYVLGQLISQPVLTG